MKHIKNEKGSVLVLVLVLLFSVLIMMFFMAFMTKSISHAKQEQMVDKSHLSVVAAEMGVDYYSSKISNEFYVETIELKREVNDLLLQTNDKGEYRYTQEQIRDIIRGKIESFFNKYSSLSYFDGPLSTHNSSDYSFNLTDIEIDTSKLISEGNVDVKGFVSGHGSPDNTVKELTFIQTYKMSNIFNEIEMEKPTDKQSLFPNNIMEQIGGTKCVMKKISGDNTIEGNCTVDVVLGSVNSNNNIVIKNSKLYVDGEVTAKNNFVIENSVVYVDGNFRAGHGVGAGAKPKFTKSKICVNGSLLKNDNNPVPADPNTDFILGNSTIYAKNSVSSQVWKENCSYSDGDDEEQEEREEIQIDFHQKPNINVKY